MINTKMEFDITKIVEEIAMQAKENQEEFIFETIHPYCENVLQLKINKEELKQILLNSTQKQQPCEDCISREEAIRIAEQGQIQGFEWQFKKLCKLSSVTPKTRWIPVSERLPEDYIHVLCQFTLGGMGECYLAHEVFHVVGGLVMTCNEVIAWMPLPQPYKAEIEEVNADGYNDQNSLG